MRLVVATPNSIIVDADGVSSIRAEDETGLFGIHRGHADFITVLAISIVRWTDGGGQDRQIATRGGILTVKDAFINIATRQAIGEKTLEELGPAVLKQLREGAEAERSERISTAALELAAYRQVQNYLATGRQWERRAGPNTESESMANG